MVFATATTGMIMREIVIPVLRTPAPQEYAARIRQDFDLCTDNDLPRRLPSVFVPQGEPLATLLFGKSRAPDQSQIPTLLPSETLGHSRHQQGQVAYPVLNGLGSELRAGKV